MPIGPNCKEFANFKDCVNSVKGNGTTEEEAKRICGVWQNQCEGKNKMATVIEETENQMIEGQETILELIKQEQPNIITNSGHVRDDSVDAILQKADSAKMTASFVIVTRQKKANLHNNKVMILPSKAGQGIVLDLHKKAPVVLFEHGALPFPVGLSEIDGQYTVQLFDDKAIADVVFTQKIPEAVFIFGLVNDGILRMSSIGFLPDKIRRLTRDENRVTQAANDKEEEVHILHGEGGMDIVESLLLEWSITATGADPGAFKQMLSRGSHHDEKVTQLLKPIFQQLAGPKTVWSPGMDMKSVAKTPLGDHLQALKEGAISQTEAQAVVLNADEPLPQLTTNQGYEFLHQIGKAKPEEQKMGRVVFSASDADIQGIERETKVTQRFDVDKEVLEASKLEYEWVSRYVSCQVKQLFNLTTDVSALNMGSYLTGLEKHLEQYFQEDVRQITYNGREIPPRYEAIQLSSKITKDFLVSGLRFMKEKVSEADDPVCLVVKQQRTWYGIEVQIYCYKEKKEIAQEIIYGAHEWCNENNFLKGESFSLLGKFLSQGQERFEDVYLKEENKAPVIRAVDNLNKKGADARNLGMIFMGPPGTGKTLSGRIMMNTTDATFIWVSARDLSAFGAMGGLQYAFDLARELHPSVLFIEDVDNYLHERAVDLLKTEMDGISQSSGVTTVLTTNYPERLPQAIIDRPGRFDDILKFDLPDDIVRRQMLASWLGNSILSGELDAVVEKTDGYSGAHLRHLVNYAQELVDDSDNGATVYQSVLLALAKIENQKDLINKTQLHNQRFECDFGSLQFPEIETEQVVPVPKNVNLASIGQRLIQGVCKDTKKKLHEKIDMSNLTHSVTNRVLDHLDARGDKTCERIQSSVEKRLMKAAGRII